MSYDISLCDPITVETFGQSLDRAGNAVDGVTVQEYRKRHPKCQYCGHLRRLWLTPFCVGRNTWCQAKEKLVNENLPRPLCRLFKARED